MHKITFYPLGNADSYLVDLDKGKKLLFDYAQCRDEEDDKDRRIDLASALKNDLKESDRNYYDVVAFTHCDDDHIGGFSEFFYLQHAEKYQDEKRVKINELWVPAAIVIEEGLTGEAAILRAEARYRLKEGKNIRVFSRPDRLKDWLKKEGIDIEQRKNLITDAGNVVPGFSKTTDGVEFFVHSPFAVRHEDKLIDRNETCLVMQATFLFENRETMFLLTADTHYDVWKDIVNITKYHKNEKRLEWDVFKISHHCSYTALNEEKGKDKTVPIEEVKWLFNKGNKKGLLISTSKPIPNNDEDKQPPHRQAANYYKDVAYDIDGEFKVTMEHPSEINPKPLVITIDGFGATLKKSI
ncbi:MAG: hypothetical protein A2243_03080, partial [Omnitrophica WOR_2 bacterium RIFOXYA2_FULL_38_17]